MAMLRLAFTLPGGFLALATPNFVVFFGDDWGWGDLGVQWKEAEGLTPNLDRLAREGLRFTDFHAGASVCTPSRAALLTGRLGLRTGVISNFGPNSSGGLPLNETTIAEHLKGRGYRTGMIGKWHLGMANGHHPAERGFDFYVGLPYSTDMGCAASATLTMAPMNDEHTALCPACQHTGEPVPACPADPSCGRQSGCADFDIAVPLFHNTTIVEQPVDMDALSDKYLDATRDFISSAAASGDPFFLYYAASHMHVPQNHAARWRNLSTTPFATRAGGGRDFAAALLEMDNEMGTIMEALDEAGVARDTLIFVTGDNGHWACKCNLTGTPGPFEGLWQAGQGGGGSAGKMTLWEGGHRQVGLARWPGTIEAGRVSDAMVSAMDIFPTLAALAGAPLAADREFDGMDLTGVLLGRAADAHPHLFHPSCELKGQLNAGRLGRYKAIWEIGGVPQCGGGRAELTVLDEPLIFDLVEDPAESTPLQVSTPAIAKVLADITALRSQLLDNIASTARSEADWGSSAAGRSANCCNPNTVNCRCEQLGTETVVV